MDHVLVRYAEIGTKSEGVQLEMLDRLADRIDERIAYEELDGTVTQIRGRLLVSTTEPTTVAKRLRTVPGVASTSPVWRTDTTIDAIRDVTDELDVGPSFGVDTNSAGDHGLSSQSVNEAIGAHIEDRTGASVDLDNPSTWVEIDIRESGAYVFTQRFDGPGGFPVGSQTTVAALISGGIDSPVAAYEVMTRGAPVVPVYFYNRPYAAGDHLARFESMLDRLERYHPGGDWSYYRVDMAPVNTALEDVDTGRMLLHRAIMFRTAAHIVEDAGLAGIVTGESIGQKSSQTATNLRLTSNQVDHPVYRPLLTATKAEITGRARELGTYEVSTVDSACRTIAPTNPATALSADRFEELAAAVDLKRLVSEAIDGITEVQR